MNWDALGAIGEIAGALGVIVSLIYLATQIRNQNKESQLTAINSMTSQWNAFMADMATNSELARIWSIGLTDLDSLDSTEFVQLSTHFNRIFRIYESMYRQQQAGRLDEELWGGLTRSMADFTKSPGVKAWWQLRGHWYSSDFGRYVQSHLDQAGEPVLTYGQDTKAPPNKALNTDP